MPRCLYCGQELHRGSMFCRGHNLAYKNRLLGRYRAGDVSVKAELERFGWLTTPESVRSSASTRITPIQFNFRKFGVEIETVSDGCSNVEDTIRFAKARGIDIRISSYTHTDCNHWKVLTDGSLRGSYCREFVSPPFRTESGFREVYKLCEAMNLLDVKVNNTCGLHVHLDASDLTPRDMARVVKFYQVYEEDIDLLHQKSRRGQNVQYTYGLQRFSIDPERITSVNELSRILGTRYLKVNVEAYLRHGTLEFRQHGGTVNPMKIEYWARFCMRVVEYAKSNNVISKRAGSLFDVLNLSEEEKTYWNIRKTQLTRGVA